jgi:hypothetical protein
MAQITVLGSVMRTSYIIRDGLRMPDHSIRQFAVLISSGWTQMRSKLIQGELKWSDFMDT